MNKKNLWESKFKDDYIFFNNFEEYIKYLIENNHSLTFTLRKGYNQNDEVQDFLDNIALRTNTEVTYTDQEHPIAFSANGFLDTYINPEYYNTHKEEIVILITNFIKEQIKNKKTFITIPDFVFNDELLEEIIKNEDIKESYFTLKTIEGIKPTQEQIGKIKSNFLDFKIDNDKISNKYAFGYYTVKQLQEIDSININSSDNNNQYENLIYLNNNATITIRNESSDEYDYLETIKNIFDILKKHSKQYNIVIEIKNRQKLRDKKIIESLPENINLFIDNDLFKYDLETYMKEEEILESIAAPIRESNLSPLEKYLAAYNAVKQFKQYKENPDALEESRYLRFILNNEYLVCVGFAKLLEELLNRINIPNQNISVGVDISYNKGFTMEEKVIENAGHRRNIIRIDDDKYNIHGIYITDATWDNDLEIDLYLNALMTFDRKKEAKRLEKLSNEDLLLDFHNLDEFTKKIEYFIKNELYRNTEGQYASYKDNRKKAIEVTYQKLINNIKKYIQTISADKYKHFNNSYFTPFNNAKTLEEKEQIIKDMLTEYYQLILPLTNNNIDISTILKAATEVKRTINGYSDEQIKEWLEKTITRNKEIEKKAFPYRYDKNNKTEAYLEIAYPEEEKTITR